MHRVASLSGQRLYLSVHEQVSHQGHGLLQGVPLPRNEGLVLVGQAAGSGHHELSDLVVQAVERLDRCKGGRGEMVGERQNNVKTHRNRQIHDG